MTHPIVCVLLFYLLSFALSEETDNRGQCTAGYSGIVCYPIDCCNRFVQCVDGVIHPPQVLSRPLAHQQDTAPGTNCKNREFILASQCSSVSCPSELPDWGSGTGGSSGDDSSGSSGSNPDNAGTDSVTGQFKLNATNHGK